jgi:hypothetical protein
LHRWQPSIAPPNIFPADQGDIFSAANNLARALREWLMKSWMGNEKDGHFSTIIYLYMAPFGTRGQGRRIWEPVSLIWRAKFFPSDREEKKLHQSNQQP